MHYNNSISGATLYGLMQQLRHSNVCVLAANIGIIMVLAANTRSGTGFNYRQEADWMNWSQESNGSLSRVGNEACFVPRVKCEVELKQPASVFTFRPATCKRRTKTIPRQLVTAVQFLIILLVFWDKKYINPNNFYSYTNGLVFVSSMYNIHIKSSAWH